jgi:hypothetical protein
MSATSLFAKPIVVQHAEHVGPEGVALLSGRRRNGGAITREAFESDLRREGFEVIHGGQKPDLQKTCTPTISMRGSWCSAVRSR